jgi:hypothetical protein
LGGNPRPEIFKGILASEAESENPEEGLPDKLVKAYARMKLKAEARSRRKRKGKNKWKPRKGDLVLIKCQHASDALEGVIGKFRRPYEGPFVINEPINPNMFELCDNEGKSRGLFHLRDFKPYLKELDEL